MSVQRTINAVIHRCDSCQIIIDICIEELGKVYHPSNIFTGFNRNKYSEVTGIEYILKTIVISASEHEGIGSYINGATLTDFDANRGFGLNIISSQDANSETLHSTKVYVQLSDQDISEINANAAIYFLTGGNNE